MRTSTKNGLLISVEGVTGAGKSTLARQLRRGGALLLVAGGYGGRRVGPDPFHRDLLNTIRRQLGRDEFLRLDWRVECLVLQAELLVAEQTIALPTLQQGGVVLYEHHADSILAYEAARLIESRICSKLTDAVGLVRRVVGGAPCEREPDVTVFIETPPDLAARRAARRDVRPLTAAARRFNTLVHEAYAVLYTRRVRPRRHFVRAASADDAAKVVRELMARHGRAEE